MKTRFVATAVSIALSIYGVSLFADGDRHHHRVSGPDVAPVSDPTYSTECGNCHFAYQPGFLPAGSWEKLMGTLEDHFGENAELGADVQKQLTEYLVKNAADHSKYKRSIKIMHSLKGETPLRITEIPSIAHEHNEVPKKLVNDNQQVKSISYCNKCHTRASAGSYSEHEVKIPGRGRWED